MNWIRRSLFLCLLGVLAVAIGSGCSSESPLEPSGEMVNPSSARSQDIVLTPASDPFQVTGRVESIDWEARQLTLIDYGYLITAREDCDIAVIEQGIEIPITFAEIDTGDSILVCGKLLENESILANRIRVYRENTCDSCEVGFRGMIATIDYAAGTFTVADRSETILTNENTLIWTRIQHPRTTLAKTGDRETLVPNDYHARFMSVYDTVLAFADLKVGDSVVVRASIVDDNVLLACRIKVASECFVRCVEFTDALALIDTGTRTVTFATEGWIGSVCPNALLADADGTPLTLSDFAPPDLVYVRGYPFADDTLKICQMIKQ